MNIRRVLCPIDFSEHSRRAVHYAEAIARWYEAELDLLYVMPLPVAGAFPVPLPLPVFQFGELEAGAVTAVREFAASAGVACVVHPRVLQGTSAADEIVAHAAVLGPHFEREEQIALPPLGLLAPLAAGERPTGLNDVLAMTDALRKELPRMLEEHQRIRAAVEKLRTVARDERASEQVELADELAAHARSEEEVLYPAAILVGDLIRARITGKQ